MIGKLSFSGYQIYTNKPVNINNREKSNVSNVKNNYKVVSSEVYRANFLNFCGYRPIIDSHTHIGKAFCADCDPPQRLEHYSNGIFRVAVSHLSALNLKDPQNGSHYLNWDYEFTPAEINTKLLKELGQLEDKERFLPLAFCQPHRDPVRNDEMARQLDEFLKGEDGKKFYGLKIHPHFSNVHLGRDIDRMEKFVNIAQKHNLPVFFHTQAEDWNKEGSSDCVAICEFMSKLVKKDEKYKKVPVILYHMNIGEGVDRDRVRSAAVKAVEDGANIFLETSWVPMHDVIEAVKAMGPKRVIFGTDAPLSDISGKAAEIESAISNHETFYGQNGIKDVLKQAMGKRKDASKYIDDNVDDLAPDKVLDRIFYENSKELFKLNNS